MGLSHWGGEQNNSLECAVGICLEHTYNKSWMRSQLDQISLSRSEEKRGKMASSPD